MGVEMAHAKREKGVWVRQCSPMLAYGDVVGYVKVGSGGVRSACITEGELGRNKHSSLRCLLSL